MLTAIKNVAHICTRQYDHLRLSSDQDERDESHEKRSDCTRPGRIVRAPAMVRNGGLRHCHVNVATMRIRLSFLDGFGLGLLWFAGLLEGRAETHVAELIQEATVLHLEFPCVGWV